MVVLVQKKDRGLCFCIDFCHLNTCTKKDFCPLPRIHEALEEFDQCWTFFMPRPKVWILANQDGQVIKTVYHAFTVGNLGFFKCDCIPFGLCNVAATFQRLMKNCLGELNLTYCLIYLDDIVVFSHTTEEHLHHLCVVFDWFREHNLKLKLSEMQLFEKRNHLSGTLSLKGWCVTQ